MNMHYDLARIEIATRVRVAEGRRAAHLVRRTSRTRGAATHATTSPRRAQP